MKDKLAKYKERKAAKSEEQEEEFKEEDVRSKIQSKLREKEKSKEDLATEAVLEGAKQQLLEEEERSPRSRAAIKSSQPPRMESASKFGVGEKVEAKWKEDGRWYAAVIDGIREGKYDVTFSYYGNTQLTEEGLLRKLDSVHGIPSLTVPESRSEEATEQNSSVRRAVSAPNSPLFERAKRAAEARKKYQEAREARKAKDDDHLVMTVSPRSPRGGLRGTQSYNVSPRHSRKKHVTFLDSAKSEKSPKIQSRGRSSTLTVPDEPSALLEEGKEESQEEASKSPRIELELEDLEPISIEPKKEEEEETQLVIKNDSESKIDLSLKSEDSLFDEGYEDEDSESLDVEDENFLVYSVMKVGTADFMEFEMAEDESYDEEVDACCIQ